MSVSPDNIIIKKLPVKLTDDEMLHMGRANAQAADEVTTLEMQKKEVVDDFKSKISGIQTKMMSRNTMLNTGEEWRDVECYEEIDEDARKVKMIRRDLGTVVSFRPMTADDYQVTLELFKSAAADE